MWLLRSHTIAQLSNMKHQSGNTQTQNLFTKGLIKYEKNEQTFLFLKEVKGKKKIKHLKPTCKVPDCLHNLYQHPSREGLMQESPLTAAGDGNGATCHR